MILTNRRKNMQKLSIYIRLLIFIPFIFVYLLLVDKGFIVYGPCDCTPGYDFTKGIILLLLYPFIAGGILYLCVRESHLKKKQIIGLCAILPIVSLFISAFISIFGLLTIEPVFNGNILWSYFYEYGCYNDTDPKPRICIAFTALINYIFLTLFFRIIMFYKRKNK